MAESQNNAKPRITSNVLFYITVIAVSFVAYVGIHILITVADRFITVVKSNNESIQSLTSENSGLKGQLYEQSQAIENLHEKIDELDSRLRSMIDPEAEKERQWKLGLENMMGVTHRYENQP